MVHDYVAEVLDGTARALRERDFAAYAARIALPFVLVTDGATRIRATPAELRTGFEEFCDRLVRLNVGLVVREVQEVRAMGATMVIASYRSRVVRGDGTVADPFESRAVLRSDGGRWRACCVINPFAWLDWVRPIQPEVEAAG
jgi:hypothetical protein